MPSDLPPELATNRLNWDDRSMVHADSAMYDLAGLAADPTRITDVVEDDLVILLPHLPDRTLSGLDAIHLQCHIGTDTLSLHRLGARVTGIDFSPKSLDHARQLADAAGASIRYEEVEVTRTAELITETFDLVYTSIGAITWLPDLASWASTISTLLRPGGTFYIRDGHPMLYTLEEADSGDLVVTNRYFETGAPEQWEESETYTDGDHSLIKNTQFYEWPHSISEIMDSLSGAGLQIIHFGEHKSVPWQALPSMTEDNGRYTLPDPELVPLAFSIVARKPV